MSDPQEERPQPVLGAFLRVGLILGAGIGLVVGVAVGNIGLGLAEGVAIGLLVAFTMGMAGRRPQ